MQESPADLAEEYRRQLGWRSWDDAFVRLPSLEGAELLDLGCAAGDLSAALSHRGARVTGIDANAELLARAKARAIPGARFEHGDLLELAQRPRAPVDGIWASFVPAYFVDLPGFIRAWSAHLRPGGWFALIEIDDFWAHEPLGPELAARLEAFARGSSYDFRSGSKLASAARSAGLEVVHEGELADAEFAFRGPASPEVLEAWAQRLDRMRGPKAYFGVDMPALREAWLECLASPEHRSGCRVVFVLARTGGAA